METGLKIKDYLEKNGISQIHLSKKTGIPVAKLNLSLNGKRKMTFREYELICGALGVEAGFFLRARKPCNEAV